MIEKGKKAELGEIRYYSGVPYRKVSSTGNANKDWQRAKDMPKKDSKESNKETEKKEEKSKLGDVPWETSSFSSLKEGGYGLTFVTKDGKKSIKVDKGDIEKLTSSSASEKQELKKKYFDKIGGEKKESKPGFKVYVDQEWYKEDKEIYDEELNEAARKLGIGVKDVALTTSDDDFEFYEKLEESGAPSTGLFSYNGVKMYSVYNEGGLVSIFTDKKNIGSIKIDSSKGSEDKEVSKEKFTLRSVMSKLSGMGGKLVNESWRKGKYDVVYEMPDGSFNGVTDDEDGLVVTVDIDSQGEGYNYFNEDGELSDLFNKR